MLSSQVDVVLCCSSGTMFLAKVVGQARKDCIMKPSQAVSGALPGFSFKEKSSSKCRGIY